ncbi:Rhodopsin, GQ-coupled [Dirofilaria immitis]
MGLMIMAIERSIILYFPNQIIFRNCQTLAYVVVLWIIGICLAIPVLTHSIPVKPNEFRYNCDIDSGLPISYPIACILIYSSCLIIILICFAALLSRNNQRRDQSLPMKSQENSVFVRQTLNHDYQSFSKLILLLIILFILFDGPYIILNILMQIRNSNEILKDNYIFRIPQDANIILNWLRLMYPLIAPSLMYGTCAEIWLNLRQYIFCNSN